MIKILSTFIVFLGLAFFFGATERSFARRKDGTYVGLGAGLAIAATYSVIVSACFFGILSLKQSRPDGWVGLCGLLGFIAAAGLVFLIYRFSEMKANWWKEFLGFSLVAFITFCVAGYGLAVLSTISDGFGGRFINWLPIVLFIIAEVVMLAQILKMKEKEYFVGVLLIAAAILIFLISLLLLPNWHKNETVVETNEETLDETYETDEYVDESLVEEEPQPEERLVGFYNLSLLNDDIEDNDFNFGWNPYDEEKTVEDYDKDFRNRLEVDPAFAAANMAWADYWLGTRYIGVFYDECDGAWDAAINAAKDAFIADDELYKATVKSFEEYLDTAELELRYAKSGITDQMYMNPYTVTGIPDIIVLKSNNHDGHFLVYIFHPKGEKKEVGYRIECGYQPTDVEKTLKITPTTTPKKPTDPSKPVTPPPTPSNDPGKDPSKGTQGEDVKPGDNKGPGPNTNNGDGSQHSSAEENPNSTQGTNQDNDKKAEELKEINDTQKVGGDSNTPSTPAPAPDASQGQKETNVVNPGNQGNGNGYGGADTPTPIKPVALDQNGQPVSNPDNPNGAWGGPTD